jgi:hypothetical protein
LRKRSELEDQRQERKILETLTSGKAKEHEALVMEQATVVA